MMIPKRNLRERVILGEKTNQDLEVKKSITNVKDQKKTYNLRKKDKLDSENKNSNLEVNVKKTCMLKSTEDVPKHQSKINVVNNENKIKLRGRRQVMKLDPPPKTKNRVSGCKIIEKGDAKNEKKFDVDIDPHKTVAFPIWRKNLPIAEKIHPRKKNFDVYDISQDEDMSRIVKGPPKKLKKISNKVGKNVKRNLDKNSNKCKKTKSDELKSNPVCNRPIPVKDSGLPSQTDEKVTEKLCLDIESDEVLSVPEPFDVTEINIVEPCSSENIPPELAREYAKAILLNTADVFEKSLLHPTMTSTPDNAAISTAPAKDNHLILNDISHIVSNNRNIVRVVIDTPDPLPAKSCNRPADINPFKMPEQKKKIPTKVKCPIKPVPKMTSTPGAAAIAAGPSVNNNLILNDISHIPSNNRNIVQVVINTPDPMPAKKSSKRGHDVTLFESPEPKKKTPNASKSPQKPVRINLIENFLLSPLKNLEESVLKPAKAYHSPDNFKAHLASSKRASEGMKAVKRKSKEDLLIEQMAKHFEEVSGTELCIE